VIIITGNATLTRAIESIQLGVKDFLLKPFEIETFITAIERTATVAKKSLKSLSQETPRSENFLGTSPAPRSTPKPYRKSGYHRCEYDALRRERSRERGICPPHP
jgi:DNA-binding NtrC family response regulator